MRFLIDECTGPSVARWLRSIGHDALGVTESMPGEDDQRVMEFARRESRVLITNDKDFGELVFKHSLEHFGVVVLRLKDESSSAKIAAVERVLSLYGDQLASAFLKVPESKISRSK